MAMRGRVIVILRREEEEGKGHRAPLKLVLRAVSAEVAPSSVVRVDVKAEWVLMGLVAPLAGVEGCPKRGRKAGWPKDAPLACCIHTVQLEGHV